MNNKMIAIYVMMLLLFSSIFSVAAIACYPDDCDIDCDDDCDDYDDYMDFGNHIPDWLQELLDEFDIENPCDPCCPDDDCGDDDDTGDDDEPSPGGNGGNTGLTYTENDKKSKPVIEILPNQDPIADASEGEPFAGLINEEINFDGSKSYDPDGEIVKWSWDFGDGTIETGEIIIHSYLRSGTYNVKLIVTDDQDATDFIETVAVIKNPNRPPTKPIVNTSKLSGAPYEEFVFYVASIDLDFDKVQLLIDWGDGTQVTSDFVDSCQVLEFTHDWASFGDYVITFKAYDGKVYSDITEITVQIKDKTVQKDTLNLTGILLLAIALLSLLLLLAIYLKRKKSK